MTVGSSSSSSEGVGGGDCSVERWFGEAGEAVGCGVGRVVGGRADIVGCGSRFGWFGLVVGWVMLVFGYGCGFDVSVVAAVELSLAALSADLRRYGEMV